MRVHALAVSLGVVVGFASACSVYNPTIRDCALKCSEESTCPSNTTCVEGYCRVANFTGACDCKTGESETCGGGPGECKAGLRICLDSRIWGPCIGEVRAGTEVCDGKDNDCDGRIDDDVSNAPACPLALGVCEFAAQTCVDGGFVNTCGAASYGPTYELVENTCDSLDNDCDGNVDLKPAIPLVQNVNAWTAESVPGGYFIFWSGTGDTSVHTQRFNELLEPVGVPGVVNVGTSVVFEYLTHVSNGGTVAVGFVRDDGTTGVVRVTTSAPDPQLLDNPTGPINRNMWSIAVLPSGVVRGAYAMDGGATIAAWDPTSGSVTQTFRNFRLPSTSTDNITLSSDGTVLAWDGDYDDGGTEESTGAVEQVEGSLTIARTGVSYSSLVATPGRVQAFETFSQFFMFFPINIDESGIYYCPDVTQASSSYTTVIRVANHAQIDKGQATRLGNEMIVGWRDSGALYVGIALPTVSQVRQKRIDMAGFVTDFALAAPPASNFITVFYRTQANATTVQGTLLCPP